MKLKQYAKLIQKLAEKHPDAIVVYATDSEGNHFDIVNRDPEADYYYDKDNGDVVDEEDLKQYEDKSSFIPAVIIN